MHSYLWSEAVERGGCEQHLLDSSSGFDHMDQGLNTSGVTAGLVAQAFGNVFQPAAVGLWRSTLLTPHGSDICGVCTLAFSPHLSATDCTRL